MKSWTYENFHKEFIVVESRDPCVWLGSFGKRTIIFCSTKCDLLFLHIVVPVAFSGSDDGIVIYV